MIKNISSASFREMKEKDNVVVIDVRTPEEVKEGYITDALHYNIMDGTFTNEFSEWDSSKTYLIYCRSGQRSAKACSILKDNGFEEVYNLEGGILGWDGAIEQ